MRIVLVAAATIGALALAGPATALDADQRVGSSGVEPDAGPRDVGPDGSFLAPLRPDAPGCLRIRVVPVSDKDRLLYVPCVGDVVPADPAQPWGGGPPIVVPVVPAVPADPGHPVR